MHRLKDVDSGERSLALKLVFGAGLPLLFVFVYAQARTLPDKVWWLVLPDLVVIATLLLLVWRLISHTGAMIGKVVWPAGTSAAREYSEQQALVARGLISEAVDSYRSYLVAFPADLGARLRLAALLADECRDVDGAERAYLEVRGSNPSPPQEWLVANGLIDLYRAAGRRDQLKAELARFIQRYGTSTGPGMSARRYLRQLVGEDPPANLSE